MKTYSFSIVLLVLFAGELGCGVSARPKPPSVSKAEIEPLKADAASLTLDHLVDENVRLTNIEYALTTSSAPRCGSLARPQSGMILSGTRFFEDHELRKIASRELDLDKHLSVLHVVPGSAADKAGIQVGDVLVSVDSKQLKESARLRKHLLKLADRSVVDFELEKQGERVETTIELERGCPVIFKLTYDYELIVRAGVQLMVGVSPGVMNEIKDDNTLAVVLAHELAHTCFDDRSKTWLEQEMSADRLGLIIAAQAGFAVDGAEAYWREVAIEYPWLIDVAPENSGPMREGFEGYSHYGIADRLAGIRNTVAQINARKASSAQQ